jgi:hypothetical protein
VLGVYIFNVNRVCNLLDNTGSRGMDKFVTAGCGVRDSASRWSKSNDNSEDDCSICMEPMTNDQTSLQCKHSFHTKVRRGFCNFILKFCTF